MTYTWYPIFNLQDFIDSGIVSRLLRIEMEDLGEREILITQGNTVGVTYDGVFMPVQFADKNPYARSPYAVAVDADGVVCLGIEVEE